MLSTQLTTAAPGRASDILNLFPTETTRPETKTKVFFYNEVTIEKKCWQNL